MFGLKLSNRSSFAIERHLNKLRLVVYDNGVENVCRKVTFKSHKEFALSAGGNIFKGRLQLHKNSSTITVVVKGKPVGCLTNEEFLNYLEIALSGSTIAPIQQ